MTVTSDKSRNTFDQVSRLRAIVSALRSRTSMQSEKERHSASELLQFIAEIAGEIEQVIDFPVQETGETVNRQVPHSGPRDFQDCLDEVVETRREVLKRLAQ